MKKEAPKSRILKNLGVTAILAVLVLFALKSPLHLKLGDSWTQLGGSKTPADASTGDEKTANAVLAAGQEREQGSGEAAAENGTAIGRPLITTERGYGSSSQYPSEKRNGSTGRLVNGSNSIGNSGSGFGSQASAYDLSGIKPYERYFQIAQLTDTETSAVEQILRQDTDRSLQALSGAGNVPLDQISQKTRQLKEVTDQALQEALPPDKWAALQQYRSSLPQRHYADQAAQIGSQQGVPFTADEVDFVTNTLHSSGVIYLGTEVKETTSHQFAAVTAMDNGALNAMGTRLTAAQISVVKSVLAGRIRIKD